MTGLALAWPGFWRLDDHPRRAGRLRAHRRLLARTEDVLFYGPLDA